MSCSDTRMALLLRAVPLVDCAAAKHGHVDLDTAAFLALLTGASDVPATGCHVRGSGPLRQGHGVHC